MGFALTSSPGLLLKPEIPTSLPIIDPNCIIRIEKVLTASLLEFSLTCSMRCGVFLLSSSVLQKHLGFPVIAPQSQLLYTHRKWQQTLPEEAYLIGLAAFYSWPMSRLGPTPSESDFCIQLSLFSGNKASSYKIKLPQTIKLENKPWSFLIANRRRFRSIPTGENFPGDKVS